MVIAKGLSWCVWEEVNITASVAVLSNNNNKIFSIC